MRIEKVEVDVKHKYPIQPSNEEIRERLRNTQEYNHELGLYFDKRNHGIWFMYFNNGIYAEMLSSHDRLKKIRIFNMQGELLNQMRFDEDKYIKNDQYPVYVPEILALGMIRKRFIDGEPPLSLKNMQSIAMRLVGNAIDEDQRLQRENSFRMYLLKEEEIL